MKTCVACAAKIEQEALFCDVCLVMQGELDYPQSEFSDPEQDVHQGLQESPAKGSLGVLRKGIKRVVLIFGAVFSILSLIVASTLSAGFGGNTVDNVRACQIFSDGYQAATLDNGSASGMRAWRAAARDGSQYANGRLAYELQRFSAGDSDGEITANIAQLCR